MASERQNISSKKPLVLITGATGSLGPWVAWAFSDAGYHLRTLSSAPVPDGLLPPDSDNHTGDITDLQSVSDAVKGVDIVVHLAALLHIINPSTSLAGDYQRINVGGTANVVKAAEQENVQRLVYFSTIAVYGDDLGVVVTEDTQPRPGTDYAKSKLAAEKIVLAAQRQDGAALGTVLRLAAAYGSRVKGNYKRLVGSLNAGRFVPLGRGENRRTLVYDRDIADGAVIAATHPDAAGRIFNLTDGQVHTVKVIIEAICIGLERSPPRYSLPVGPARGIAGLIDEAAKLVGLRSPITRETIDKYTEDIAVNGNRMITELAFNPRYDLLSGWKETVQEMRNSGDL